MYVTLSTLSPHRYPTKPGPPSTTTLSEGPLHRHSESLVGPCTFDENWTLSLPLRPLTRVSIIFWSFRLLHNHLVGSLIVLVHRWGGDPIGIRQYPVIGRWKREKGRHRGNLRYTRSPYSISTSFRWISIEDNNNTIGEFQTLKQTLWESQSTRSYVCNNPTSISRFLIYNRIYRRLQFFPIPLSDSLLVFQFSCLLTLFRCRSV